MVFSVKRSAGTHKAAVYAHGDRVETAVTYQINTGPHTFRQGEKTDEITYLWSPHGLDGVVIRRRGKIIYRGPDFPDPYPISTK